MSGFCDVNIVSCNVGALTNDFRPMFKIPTGGGGVTFIDAASVQEGSGTTSLHLVDLGTAGTAIGGTILSAGSAVSVAGVPGAMGTEVTLFVSEGHWVGAKEANVGTTNAITIVSCSYVMGKS
jgi:hypothetical protein